MSNGNDTVVSIKILTNDSTSSPQASLPTRRSLFEPDWRPLAGLRLIGFASWERRDGGRNVTFPARAYSVIRAQLSDGTRIRDRTKAPGGSKAAAQRWAEARERVLITQGKPQRAKQSLGDELKPVPTRADFAPRFLDGYARANRQKPSGIAAKEPALRVHLLPHLGDSRSNRSRSRTCSA